MINRKGTFFLGILVFLLPFIGLPTFWKTLLSVFIGTTLAFSSVEFYIPRKNIKSRVRKEKVSDITIENIPVYPRDNIIDVNSSPTPTTFPKVEKRKLIRKVKSSV